MHAREDALLMIGRSTGAWLVCGLLLAGAEAAAQRRDGSAGPAPMSVTLATAARFGEQVVPARSYRVGLGDGKLTLADPTTMVTQAVVAATESAGAGWVSPPTAEVRQKGTSIEIVVKSGDRVYVATGARADPPAGKSYDVALAKADASIDLGGGAAAATDKELVAAALARFGEEVKRCAEKAQKGRWITDDPRFHRCACPLAAKWRMPKVAAALRWHHDLAKGKSGMSFTVTPEGKVTDCRVWVAARSPELEPPAAAPAVPEAAPPPAAAPSPEAPPAPAPAAEPAGAAP